MLISKDLYTVTIILQSYGGNTAAAMAGYVVASLPILALFAYGMEYYVEGLTSAAVTT
jgi:ABC-type glycerol-3-phosphate transport system permease component